MCQACHGDASEHSKDPTRVGMPNRFAKRLSGDEKSQLCLACQDGHRQLAFGDSGKHRKNDVACNDCHNIHGKPANPSVSPFVTTQRTLQYETCNTCHKNIRSQINKTPHHPIVEGKVACSDCQNPHGALSHAIVKNESVNQLCIDCHGDKRGPFVWEHAPVEENCLSCHNAHGSNHAKLLNEKVPNLCQDCHDWSRHPGTFYGGNASNSSLDLMSARLGYQFTERRSNFVGGGLGVDANDPLFLQRFVARYDVSNLDQETARPTSSRSRRSTRARASCRAGTRTRATRRTSCI